MQNTLKEIGYIETPYKSIEECPRNIDFDGPLCNLTVKKEYSDGLLGLESGQEILILYWLENTNRDLIIQHPRGSEALAGTFSIRSPHRPNPIGAAILPIMKIENDKVYVKGLDCLDGTPLLDIKPAIKHEKE